MHPTLGMSIRSQPERCKNRESTLYWAYALPICTHLSKMIAYTGSQMSWSTLALKFFFFFFLRTVGESKRKWGKGDIKDLEWVVKKMEVRVGWREALFLNWIQSPDSSIDLYLLPPVERGKSQFTRLPTLTAKHWQTPLLNQWMHLLRLYDLLKCWTALQRLYLPE